MKFGFCDKFWIFLFEYIFELVLIEVVFFFLVDFIQFLVSPTDYFLKIIEDIFAVTAHFPLLLLLGVYLLMLGDGGDSIYEEGGSDTGVHAVLNMVV